MKAKNVLYAAVGAPVVVARKVGARASDLGTKLSEQAGEYGQLFERTFDGWAVEGEKVIVRISEGKVVDEIKAKVDLDEAREQVSKLRDQLEDMLSTWRSSFRPEKTISDQIEADRDIAEAPETEAAAATAESPAVDSVPMKHESDTEVDQAS